MDEIDFNRAEVHLLIYLRAEVHEGVTRVYPGVHGIYETWQAAEAARRTKTNPKDYYVCSGRYRNVR